MAEWRHCWGPPRSGPAHPPSTCFRYWLPAAPTYLLSGECHLLMGVPFSRDTGGLFPPCRGSPQPMAVWYKDEQDQPSGL